MLREMRLQQTNRPIDVIRHWHEEREGGLFLEPPYQRGDVWGTKRRVNLIRSILLGVPIPSLIINDRLHADWEDDFRIAVIDGKQRITALLMFIGSDLPVPAAWFDAGKGDVVFELLPRVTQRRFLNQAIPFSEGRLPTLKAEQEVFDLVNFGGLAQGEIDAA